MKIHNTYINRCIALAKNGLPAAMPNPSVGAVLVYNNKIIAEGYTSAYGGSHAEVNCIAFAKANTPELIAKSTLYVSLEPCSHWGKTPPCADLVVASGIKKVVIGTIDPFAKVAGAGIKRLIQAGVDVTVGVQEKECQEINKRFFTYHEKKRPYIILKWAETADGFIAPKTRDAQEPVWITNSYSRQLVHKWRSEEMAILVGGKTVLEDNPSLTTRDWEGKNPLRVVIDTKGNLDKNLAVFNQEAETLVIPSTDPQLISETLYDKGIQSVIIEGGAQTLQYFIDANHWDEARAFKGNTSFSEGTKAPQLSQYFLLEKTDTILDNTLHYYKNSSI
ncbi:bifunctional diaminohydroxyphosphoribosylaminopyrimidine deaminase/5-amino-6-(5-phosphoribosylamino)uracil reductase RibD [uncultured Dokdonia sp.]|uniref:bifunctional diaminohydroxyphosphoribosylaminopyrimidine deaminase/5-amino-6-(5-phosphoribosylamino)uracil reductase RibD n=1 Tax=Dokdonia sp. R78006 TaxID=3093866 RepID=UPI0026164989|nr:bifunctional diaminohydroxyphosphoribosylaminopyrimidine deaminase/5-amino-6-(5-phosphoribosylamino)uracil reductase RibD [uncultured Dokdonia sp.]